MDFLRGCPSPLEEKPEEIAARVNRPVPEPEELRSERAELELETMRVMSRTQRLLIMRLANARESARDAEAELEQVKKQRRKARRRAKRLNERLERFRQSPLARMRRAAGKRLGR